MTKQKTPPAVVESSEPPTWRTLAFPLDDRLHEPPGPNPNVMSEQDLQLLADNMRRTGCVQPVLARVLPGTDLPPSVPGNDDARWLDTAALEVIDGSHRVEAARRAGFVEIPVTVASFSDERARALRIGMNKLRGELDLSAVGASLTQFADLAAIDGGQGDLQLTGYGAEDIADLIAAVQPSDDEANAMAALGGVSNDAPEPAAPKERRYLLEVSFADKAQRDRCRRVLDGLGGGDLRAGLLLALEQAGEGEDEENHE